jgi:transglutaminase-like putative cysteine protease
MRFAHVASTHPQWVLLVVLLAGGWVALGGRGSALASRAVGSGREVTCTYLAHVNRLPRDARAVQVWIPLARTGRQQRILRRDVHVPVPYTIAQDPEYGNDILHVTLEPPTSEDLEVAIEYHAQLLNADTASTELPPTPRELQYHLQPSGLVIIDDEVRARARQATVGRRTRVAQARGIYDQVRQVMVYDKTVPGWGRGDTRRACLLGKGNCTDFHSLFISMARAQRIPARFKIGVVIPQQPSGVIPGYHCWAEFYLNGRGWVPVDASEAWKHPELADYYFGTHDPSRFLISVGRDIRLVPRQQGEPVNIFFSPYVEVDGQTFSDVDVEVRFADLQQGRMT